MPYEVERGNLFKWVHSGKNAKRIHLCNFVPHLVADTVYDNGREQNRYYTVGGVHEDGTTLPEQTMSVSEFSAMNWVSEKWGARCNIEAGNATKEHIRHAIQFTAEYIQPNIIYSHSGFREIDGAMKFLLEGMETSCDTQDSSLKHYYFPSGIDESKTTASLELLESELAPLEILYPLIIFQYLAPLTHLFNMAGHMPKSVLVLAGRTGSKKSTVAALMLSHFGNFTFSTLPLTFRDTGNSITERLFTFKDLPTVVDDLHPTSGGYEESAMMKTFQLIMRAFGDNTGRASLNQRRELKEAKTPRGIGMITAEFLPNISESGLARCLEVKITPNDVDVKILTEWQKRAEHGDLAMAMKLYVLWLESKLTNKNGIEKFVANLKKDFEFNRTLLRETLTENNVQYHDRTPEACAYLLTANTVFSTYLSEKGVLDGDAQLSLYKQFFEIVVDLAERQSALLATTSNSEKFVEQMTAMLTSGFAELLPKEKCFAIENDCIGFYDDKFCYLNMPRAIKLVRKYCLEVGEPMPPKSKQLAKELDEDGFLVATACGDKNPSMKLANGKNTRVSIFNRELFGESIQSISMCENFCGAVEKGLKVLA